MDAPDSKGLNLKTFFKADLKEYPENPSDMADLANRNHLWISEQMKKPESEWDVVLISNTLGTTAGYCRVLNQLDLALEMIETSLSLIDQFDLDVKHFVIQSLRWADILKYKKEFEKAEEIFEDLIVLTRLHPDVADYEDFAHQHLGKLHFDLSEFDDALFNFEKALEIRELKKDSDLLHSTKLAIKITQEKIQQIKK